MKTDATQDRANNRLGQLYTSWFTGNGATQEFFLPKNIGRLDDLHVSVDGADKRPFASGTAFDFSVRGLSGDPAYPGEPNAIKFTVAPGNTKNICVRFAAT